jgi:hypothetical protein
MNISDAQKPGDMKVIREFFFDGVPVSQFSTEYKALSAEDKAELAEGIRNGSLTY